jgi:hypothetical protein
MNEDKLKRMGITFNGQVTINGPMFDIHDNQHVETHIHYTERGENETDANGETNENGPTGSASARPAKPAEPATFPATALDEIFHPALNVDSVKSALWDILGQKGEAGKGQMKSLKHWFIIHKVLEEIDWLTDRQDTSFIKWVEQVFGWPWNTRDFKSVLSPFKKEHSATWNADTCNDRNTGREYSALARYVRETFVTLSPTGKITDREPFMNLGSDGKPKYISHPANR